MFSYGAKDIERRMKLRSTRFILVLGCALALHAQAETPDKLADEGDWAAALGAYLSALEKNPADAVARKEAWRAAMRLGLFEQAASLNADLDARELAALDGDRIALDIRHGRIDARTLNETERYRRLDAALAATDALAAAFQAGHKPDAEEVRRLIDRISALAARNRPGDAVALYTALAADGIEIPIWALSEVAGAYLTIRQPREAETLYRKVLAVSPDDFDANLGLFYALVESEQLDLATAHIDRFAASLPARRHRDGLANGERLSAETTSDQARLYADRIPEAKQRIEQRLAETPFNSEVRSAETSLHLARGWPRQGEADLRRTLGSDPRNPSLHADRAEVLLSLQHWDDAWAELDLANGIDPDNPRVREASQTFALHEKRELSVDAGYGHGKSSNPYGSSDWFTDTRLYSSPIDRNWRAFVHNYSGSADFNGGKTYWIRTGAGAEWRSGSWQMSGEVNAGEQEDPGILATLRWQPDDYWKFDVHGESKTNDIPLQAVNAGVTASRIGLGIDWRAHEARKLAVEGNVLNFTDGNLRKTVIGTWFERWLSGPRWSFETTIGADASNNSIGYRADYFNPPNDHSYWVTGAVEQLAWRDYNYSFRQRLALSLGSYWQSGYGAGSTESLEYQHSWELGRAAWLRYSIGRTLRPYDGEREQRTFGTMTLLWRF